MSDDQKSQASVDSTNADGASLSVIRYNTLDELLFNLLLTFHKENQFPIAFSIVCLFWTVLNGISVTFTWNNWPLWGFFGKLWHDFFSWTDLSVSWQWDYFLMTMNFIFYIVTMVVVIGLSVLTVLNRKERPVPNIVTQLIGGTQYLLTHLFSYSGINVLMGYYWCFGPRSNVADPYHTVHLTCNTMDIVLMYASTFVMLVFFVVGVLERMFVFVYDSKLTPDDPFTGQSGFYNAMTCVLLNVFSIVALILRAHPAATAITGLVFFFILCFYAYVFQPYYYPSGNAISAGCYAFCVITFIFSCGTLAIKKNYFLYDRLPIEERTKANLPLSIGIVVLFWLTYAITSVGSGFLMAYLTYKKSKKEWAMDVGEELPIPKSVQKRNEKDSSVKTFQLPGPIVPTFAGPLSAHGASPQPFLLPALNTLLHTSAATTTSSSSATATASSSSSSSLSLGHSSSLGQSPSLSLSHRSLGGGVVAQGGTPPPPSLSLGPPSLSLGPPSLSLGPPSLSLGPPSLSLGPPSLSLGPPSLSLGPPSLSLGPPSLVPSLGLNASGTGTGTTTTSITSSLAPPTLAFNNNPFSGGGASSSLPTTTPSLSLNPFGSGLPNSLLLSSSSSVFDINTENNGMMQLKPARTIPKFYKAGDVLHAIRYLGVEALSRRSDCVELAEEILLAGRKKFPTSSELFIGIALFQMVYTGNENRMGEALRNARQNIPTFVERWLIFVLMRDIDRRAAQGHSGDDQSKDSQSSTRSFRLGFQRAQRSYELSKAFLVHAYNLLGKANTDLNKSMRLLSKAIEEEDSAHRELTELLELHPQSVPVLRLLGALLRDIYRDDDSATQLFVQATQIEDESAEDKADYNNEKNEDASQGGASVGGASVDKSKRKKKKKRQQQQQQQMNMLLLQKKKQDLLTIFFPLLVLNFIVCVASVIVGFVLTNSTFSTCTKVVDVINNITSTMTYLIDLELMMKLKIYLGVNLELPDSYIYSKATIDKYIHEEKGIIDDFLDKIYANTKNNDEFALWEGEYILQAIVSARLQGTEYVPKTVIQTRVNLIELIKNMGSISIDFVNKFDETDSMTKRHVSENTFYYLTNVAVVTMESMKNVALHYAGNSRKNSSTQMWIGIIQGSICVTFNIVVILAQYCIYTRKLNKERREVFLAFLMVPKEKIKKLRKRIEDVDKEAEEDNNPVDNDSRRGGGGGTVGESSSDGGSEGGTGRPRENSKGSGSGIGEANAGGNDDDLDEDFAVEDNAHEATAHISSGDIEGITAVHNNNNNSGSGSSMKTGGWGSEMLIDTTRKKYKKDVSDSENDDEDEDDESNENDDSEDSDVEKKKKKKKRKNKKKKKSKKDATEIAGERQQQLAQEELEAAAAAAAELSAEKERTAQEKAERERMEMEEQSADLSNRVDHMESSIPASFFVRAVAGFLFLVLCPVGFYVICAIAVNKVVERDVIIFVSEYRSVVMYLIVQCAMALTNPADYTLPAGLVNCSFATTPMWRGFELLSNDREVLQSIMGTAIHLLVELNRLIIEGATVNDPNHVTGDSLIDGYKTPRTVTPKSETVKLLYNHETCFPSHEGDCGIEGRIPTLDPTGFAGLSALLDFFIAHAMTLQNWDFSDGAHGVTMDNPSVQGVIAPMMYDLRAGVTKYRQILVSEQEKDIDMYKTLLVLFFVLSIIFPLTGFVCCLMPTREVLIGVAFVSHKLAELNPSNEDSSKNALGAAQWNESYVIDAPRFDNAHHHLCSLCVNLIVEMDPSIDVGVQVMQEIGDMKTTLAAMRKERERKIVEKRPAELRAQGFSEDQIALTVQNEQMKVLREGHIKNPIMQALSDLMIACFAILTDEEYVMKHYRIVEQHRRMHFNSHASFLRKLQGMCLSIAGVVHKQSKDVGKLKDFSPELNQLAQVMIQHTAAWMTDHVGKIDREMVMRIGGKVPESELTEVEINLTDPTVPYSMREFLTSDNASIQDRNVFEKIKKVLHLD